MHFSVKDLHIECADNQIEEIVKDADGVYYATFDFDADWDGKAKTARFLYNDKYVDSLVSRDNKCIVPSEIISYPADFKIVVYADEYNESLVTSNYVCVRIIKSLLSQCGYSLPEGTDVYTKIAQTAGEALSIARSVEERANSGEFNGRDGDDLSADKMDKFGEYDGNTLTLLNKAMTVATQDHKGTVRFNGVASLLRTASLLLITDTLRLRSYNGDANTGVLLHGLSTPDGTNITQAVNVEYLNNIVGEINNVLASVVTGGDS